MKDETPAWLSYADENLDAFQCLAGCNAGSGDMRKVCTYRSQCRGEYTIGIKGQGG